MVILPGNRRRFGGNDLYTKLLLHGNGTDGSAVFTDSSRVGRSVTRSSSDVVISTSYKKYGPSSILFGSVSGYLTTVDSSDFYFAANNFTIDFWVRMQAYPAEGQHAPIYQQWYNKSNYSLLSLYRSGGIYTFEFGAYLSGTKRLSAYALNATNPTPGVWYHVALVRYGTTMFFFVQGVKQDVYVGNTEAYPDYAAPFEIGHFSGMIDIGWNETFLGANIDEFSVSTGIARWVNSFTPSPYAYL